MLFNRCVLTLLYIKKSERWKKKEHNKKPFPPMDGRPLTFYNINILLVPKSFHFS